MTFEEAKTWIARSGLNRSADALAAIVAEFERLKNADTAYEQTRKDNLNLTEKVIPNLREQIAERDARIAELEAELKRVGGFLAVHNFPGYSFGPVEPIDAAREGK